MPLPFLALAGLGTLGLFGVKKGYDAYCDNEDANALNAEAQEIIDEAKEKAEKAREGASKAISNLGKKKIDVLDSSVKVFIDEYSKLKNVDFQKSLGLMELSKIKFDKEELKELSETQQLASSMVAGVASGTALGAATAFGAYGATMTFAAASTGTAISGLSGVAATNATLAWLGGGSLAAGGAGVAGGMMVLGGLVAAPALAIFGAVMSSKASAKKDEAYSNRAKAREFAEATESVIVLCNGMAQRANAFNNVLNYLDYLLNPLVSDLRDIIRTSGIDYAKFNINEQKTVAECVSVAIAVKAVLDTPVLTKEGKVDPKSGRVLEKASTFLAGDRTAFLESENQDDDLGENCLEKAINNTDDYKDIYDVLLDSKDTKNLYEAGYALQEKGDIDNAIKFYNASAYLGYEIARNRLRTVGVYSLTDPYNGSSSNKTKEEFEGPQTITENKGGISAQSQESVQNQKDEHCLSEEDLAELLWKLADAEDAKALRKVAKELEKHDLQWAIEFYEQAADLGDVLSKKRLDMFDK